MLKKIFSSKKEKRDISIDKQLDLNKLPQHVGIIMDGNGRWATGKGLIRTSGHKAGVKTLKKILKTCIKYNIPILTVYAFSTENWNRPDDEVAALMKLLKNYLKDCIKRANSNNMRVRVIGERSRLEPEIVEKIEELEECSKNNTGITFIIALNYGARDEIVRGIRKISRECAEGKIAPEDITEDMFNGFLDTHDIPDPDLLIRTSGELRLSNYLLWQLAYTEFYFTDVLWPDFNKEELKKAIAKYNERDRRFGKVEEN